MSHGDFDLVAFKQKSEQNPTHNYIFRFSFESNRRDVMHGRIPLLRAPPKLFVMGTTVGERT